MLKNKKYQTEVVDAGQRFALLGGIAFGRREELMITSSLRQEGIKYRTRKVNAGTLIYKLIEDSEEVTVKT